MPSRWHKCIVLAAAIALAAPDRAAESVVATVEGTRFPDDQLGGGGSLLLKEAGDGGGVLFGIADTKFPVGSLGTVDLDGYRITSAQLAFSAGVSLGQAREDPHESTLFKARMSVDAQLDKQWSARLSDQYIDLDDLHGHLLMGSAEFRPAPRWGIKTAAGYSVSGTLADRYGEIALHWYGTKSLFGGVVLGRTGYDPATLEEIAAVKRLFQVYLGTSIPITSGTLNLSIDTLNLEGMSRQTVRIGFIRPLAP